MILAALTCVSNIYWNLSHIIKIDLVYNKNNINSNIGLIHNRTISRTGSEI